MSPVDVSVFLPIRIAFLKHYISAAGDNYTRGDVIKKYNPNTG